MEIDIELSPIEVKRIIARHFAVSMEDVFLNDLMGNEEIKCRVVIDGDVDTMANFGDVGE